MRDKVEPTAGTPDVATTGLVGGLVVPQRRSRGVAGGALVTIRTPSGRDFEPADVCARVPGVHLMAWLEGSLALVQELLAVHGAVRIRGMGLLDGDLGQVVSTVAGSPLLDYVNRSTPRQRVHGNVFTSTEYNPDLSIPMHNEQSYTTTWPAVLGFLSEVPATSGGETPLVRSRDMVEALPDDVVARFDEHGVSYERWYQPNIDLSWQEVFQTADKDVVTEACSSAGIESRWYNDGTLWTRQVSQATIEHPTTGERVWFNQANLFHVAALPASLRQAVREASGGRPPRDARFGDGQPIPDDVIDLINDTYTRLAWAAPWSAGDVVLVDNLFAAHGRHSYEGPRRTLVAMAGVAGAEAPA